MRGPDAAADALARLEDDDIVPVDGEVPRGRQPRDTGADHENLACLRTHVSPASTIPSAGPASVGPRPMASLCNW